MDNTESTFSTAELIRSSFRPIVTYLDDPDVQEVMINAPNDVWIERAGKMERVNVVITKSMIDGAIRILGGQSGKNVREGDDSSIVNARMPGFRIAAILAPVSVRGPSISIRKHSNIEYTLADYVEMGAMGLDQAEFLRKIVLDRKNILVSGGTSSGKTTFLNAMIREIDEFDRILTVEDTQELKVRVPNWVALESNKQAGVTTVSLIEMCLRYRPDRILVGEVRGPEAAALMEACNTGHDGSLATLHADNGKRTLSRLETLVMRAGMGWPLEAIRKEIAETFHYIVNMRRVRGKRVLNEIISVDGYDLSTQAYLTETLFQRS